jgi:hypothetical protein
MPGLRCWSLLLQILLLVVRVSGKSATGDRVLVVHEEESIQSAFSQFFDSLKSIVAFLNPKQDQSASLTKYEERQYDHIVLFPQKLKGIHGENWLM